MKVFNFSEFFPPTMFLWSRGKLFWLHQLTFFPSKLEQGSKSSEFFGKRPKCYPGRVKSSFKIAFFGENSLSELMASLLVPNGAYVLLEHSAILFSSHFLALSTEKIAVLLCLLFFAISFQPALKFAIFIGIILSNFLKVSVNLRDIELLFLNTPIH